MKVLITGGAGFIGSALARQLLAAGHEVTILDNFNPQVHGGCCTLAADIATAVQLIPGDVRNAAAWEKALVGQEAVVHLAAETGTGQSMYHVHHYCDVNAGGTALLMELLLTGKYKAIQTLVVASSRAVYGEGAYTCSQHELVYPNSRNAAHMQTGDFEPKCPFCSRNVVMVPTAEETAFRPVSLYGLTKQVQEQMVLMYASTLGINGFALRYQNVYGPGQSLKNPYTGILAIFSNQARANEPIFVFEDGKESRDFVFIDDVVEATVRAVEADPHAPVALNVGTGVPISVLHVVEQIVRYFHSASKVAVNGAYREGDIRHNCADTKRIDQTLHFVPNRQFDDGIRDFLQWTETQELAPRSYEQSLVEMKKRGLMHG